ncbi:non-ribosomal peptide synthetase, partial [Pseudonocardia saturnea]
EIDTALQADPEVAAGVTVVVGERTRRRLVAYVTPACVTPADGSAPDPTGLADRLRRVLPDHAVPGRIVVVDALPLTGNGKIDRAALETLAEHQGPGTSAAPLGELEKQVAAVWEELLGIASVARDDSFFALGGDSVVATRMVARLTADGVTGAGLGALFASPTLAGYCAGLTAGDARTDTGVVADPASRYEPFPTTDVQRAYLVGRREDLVLGGIGTHYYGELDLPEVDVAAWERAWNIVIARHDMLRAVVDDDGTQRVLPEVGRFTVPVEHGIAALDPMREQMSRRVFDPARWPLMEARAVHYLRDGEPRTRLGIGLDNIVLDAASVMQLFTELDALVADPAATLPEPAVTFRDYLVQGAPDPARVAAAETYWRSRLDDLPPAPPLPLAADPAGIARPRFTRRADTLSPGEWSAIREQAVRAGVTPSAVLLACYAEVLSRWSGAAGLTVNLTLFDRRPVHADIDRVLGDFTSLLLVGCRAVPGECWLDRVRRLQEQLWRDLDHRETSAVWVMRELARATGRPETTMPVVFTSALGLDADTLRGAPSLEFGITHTPQVWLDNQVVELSGGLHVSWDAVQDLFDDGVLDTMFTAYTGLLRSLADASWSQPLGPTLPERQEQVRAAANSTGQAHDPALLHAGMFEWAAREPERVAVPGALTYGELADRALRVAGYLVGEGVRPGDAVAVSLPRGVDQVVAVFGVLAAGGVYVPVSPELPQARGDRMRERAGVVCTLDAGSRMQDTAALPGPVAVDPDRPAYVIFTSGTTGDPKGVEVTHAAAMNTVADVSARFGVGVEDRVLAVSALDFDLSVFDLFGLLSAGGQVVTVAPELWRDAAAWADLVAEHRVTVWNTVPALLDMLLTAAPPDSLESLRTVLVSGDWVGLDLAPRLVAAAPQARLVALGGATEAAVWSNFQPVPVPVPERWTSVPYGRPLAGQCFRVVDPLGRDCPDHVTGELWIGGAGVAVGYRGDPELTAAKFVPHDGQRWYRTGDLGRYWPDGTLEFLGRADTQVKVRGHRIELGEIDTALLTHHSVDAAVAVATGDRGRRRITAFVTPTTAQLDVLPAHLTALLPEHMVPARIVAVDALPLTGNGKIDRAALDTLAEHHGLPTRDAAPAGEIEQRVAALWAELLGVAAVGRGDDFFALGGDSIVATRMVARLAAGGIAGAELGRLFTAPVLADYCTALHTGIREPVAGVVADPEHRHTPFALTDVQRAYWIGRQTGPA